VKIKTQVTYAVSCNASTTPATCSTDAIQTEHENQQREGTGKYVIVIRVSTSSVTEVIRLEITNLNLIVDL